MPGQNPPEDFDKFGHLTFPPKVCADARLSERVNEICDFHINFFEIIHLRWNNVDDSKRMLENQQDIMEHPWLIYLPVRKHTPSISITRL